MQFAAVYSMSPFPDDLRDFNPPSPEMLQTKPLQDLLSQALSSTIHTAVIATPQGTLIANAINLPANLPSQAEGARRKARSLGAIANVIWKNYANIKDVAELWETANGESGNGRKEGLIWMSIECEVPISFWSSDVS
jgi:hypothetical protein